MKRHSDRRRLLIAYCAFGLLLGFAQIAMSAEICVTDYRDPAIEQSDLLKKAVALFRGQKLTDAAKVSHLKLTKTGQIQITHLTTDDDNGGALVKTEELAQICDTNGKLNVFFQKFGWIYIELSADKPCFKVLGLKGWKAGDKGSFCQGEMPQSIRVAVQREEAQKMFVSIPIPASNTAFSTR